MRLDVVRTVGMLIVVLVIGVTGRAIMARGADEPMGPPIPIAKSEQLGLIRLWIDQGAKGEVRAAAPIEWQAPAGSVQPIYAVSVSPEGQYAAAGRGNQIHLYHLPTQQFVGALIDPKLASSGMY